MASLKIRYLSDQDRSRADGFVCDAHDVAKNPPLTPTEITFTRNVQGELTKNINESDYTPLDTDQMFPKDAHLEGDESGVGIARCIGVVQTTSERLLAW